MQKISLFIALVIASSSVFSWGNGGGGGGNKPPTASAIVATVAVPIDQLKASRKALYSYVISELLKNSSAADLPECTGDEKWFSPLCIKAYGLGKDSEGQGAKLPKTVNKRYALLIANSTYKAPIPDLDTPVNDVTEISKLLQSQYGYETTVERNLSKKGVIQALEKMAAKVTPADSVLVFYAGHGYYLDEIKMGFWIPTDGSVVQASSWISNSDITKLVKNIPAQQILLVSDSCYSGTLTSEKKIVGKSRLKPQDVLGQRSVTALSSGGDEPVADDGKQGHSIFAWHFIHAIQSGKPVEPGVDLWGEVRRGVMVDYPQEPQYGALLSAGHSAGADYLFLRP